ncbi:MAG: YciI family protein [Pseudomonadota bacterium]
MPLYALYGLDHRPEGVAIRAVNRPAHLEWLKSLGDEIKLAGPLFCEDGETIAGSLVVMDVADLEAAHELATHDPYHKAGLFASVDIRLFNWVVNPPE